MFLIRCKVSDESRHDYTAVEVNTVEGLEILTLEKRFLVKHNGDDYLQIIKIGQDKENGLTLVQLPTEADSGANRVWIRTDDIIEKEKALA